MSKVFGIDLGTTYSCIAYIDEYGKPVVLKNSEGEHTTPSVVMIESASNIVVGNEAKRSIELDSNRIVQFVKRKMGMGNDTVVANNSTYHAPEISAWILKKLVNDANEDLRQTGVLKDGEKIKDVVITCPAYFGMNEREATKTAGKIAGLNVLNIINEPTAAAISYGISGTEKEETVLVYDLGGGTFDITVMNISGGNITVVCTGGDSQLGGKDWDESLMNYVIDKYLGEFNEDLSDDPETIARLYVDVESWKKSLTTREKVNISVNGSSGRFREELTRSQYEELTSNLLNRTKNLLDDVLSVAEKKGYPMSRIDKVLLVGGSSRMPQVSNMIEKDYHITPVLSDPDEAVAKGAAVFANSEKQYNDFIQTEANRSGKTVESILKENSDNGYLDKKFAMSCDTVGTTGVKLNITNVLSRTYGIGVYNGSLAPSEHIISNMLMTNDKLPAKTTKTFYTLVDNQSSIDIEIYESNSTEENLEVDNREPITVINMKFNGPVRVETAVNITFELDNSGLLHIVAEEQQNYSKLTTTFQLSNQMDDSELLNAAMRMEHTNVE